MILNFAMTKLRPRVLLVVRMSVELLLAMVVCVVPLQEQRPELSPS